MSQLLPCFLSSACQIPAEFLLLLFLAPSFSSLCHLLNQTPELVPKSPQLHRLPFCSPEERSGNPPTQSQDTLGAKLIGKPWGSQGHDVGAAPLFCVYSPTPPSKWDLSPHMILKTVFRIEIGGRGLEEMGEAKHLPFKPLPGRWAVPRNGRGGQSPADR